MNKMRNPNPDLPCATLGDLFAAIIAGSLAGQAFKWMKDAQPRSEEFDKMVRDIPVVAYLISDAMLAEKERR